MWLLLAFLSAVLLGFYDAFKKESLRDNAVLPVLFLNTVFSSLVFLPFILLSFWAPDVLGGSMFDMPVAGWEEHKYILLKSFIVLSSWIFGYFGMKHLPLTIVGPINATRPVMVLIGALVVFGERLNLYQWVGVWLAVLSFFMLSRSGKKEGIDFKHNKWILFIVLAAVTGAISGLYDKYLMTRLHPMLVQSWYNVYQVFIMCPIILLLWYPQRKTSTPFRWEWTIVGISLFLCAADFVYFYALSYEDSMISIVSMVRRGSVVVSFLFGALFFHEKNSLFRTLAILMAIGGVYALSYSDSQGETNILGVVIVLISAVGYALYLVTVGQRKNQNLKGLRLTFYVFLFSTIILLAGMSSTGSLHSIPDMTTAGNLLLLAIIPTIVSNLTLIEAIKYIGATQTSVLGAMEPVTAVIVGIAVFGEAFTFTIAVGIVLIISAVTIIILKK